MSQLLIKLAFEKAEIEIGSSVKSQKAQHISDVLLEDYKYPISERRLRDYFTNYVENNNANNEALKAQLIEPLCKYLGYKNYASFVLGNQTELEPLSTKREEENEKEEVSSKGKIGVGLVSKNKNSLILFSSAIVLSGLTYFGLVQEDEKCMIWKEDHYEKTVCTGTDLERPFEELIFKEFRKIDHLDSLVARRENQKELWYAKTKGTVEFFTYHGYHPENNEDLKVVTDYIFKKYVLGQKKINIEGL